jgi:predicted nucleotidyltransferase
MRLSENEKTAIPFFAREIFGSGTIVRLFGSRVDDSKKGGDIDLCLQVSEELDPRILLLKKAKFLAKLEQCIGEQKIDLLVMTKNNRDLPIVRSAFKEGIVL